jgi:hypothetical protein
MGVGTCLRIPQGASKYSAIRRRQRLIAGHAAVPLQAHWLDERHQDLIRDLGEQLIGSL